MKMYYGSEPVKSMKVKHYKVSNNDAIMGAFDLQAGVNIGSMADDIEIGGFMVANMRYIIKKILTDNPYCKIFVITSINCRSHSDYNINFGISYKGDTSRHFNNLGLQDIFDRMKKVCDYHGIEIINMTHSSI